MAVDAARDEPILSPLRHLLTPDFEQAEIQFDHVQAADPFRMEEVDIYSNMLYVMGKRTKLAQLAHQYSELDRNRPEVCTLIGTSPRATAH